VVPPLLASYARSSSRRVEDTDDIPAGVGAMVAPIPRSPEPAARGSFAPPPWTQRSKPAGDERALPVPLVEPALRLFSDLASVPGFAAGKELGATARLVLDGVAYLRSSALVASSGNLGFLPAMRSIGGRDAGTALGGAEQPLLRMEGKGRLLLRVPRFAAAVREVRTLVVLESALVGFEGGFTWENRTLLGLDVVHLAGTGSILLDTAGPLVLAQVEPATPFHAAKGAVVAWSDGLTLSLGEVLEFDPQLLGWSGSGQVLLVEREGEHSSGST
jgi:uncharacterized protein (AIM24 family)